MTPLERLSKWYLSRRGYVVRVRRPCGDWSQMMDNIFDGTTPVDQTSDKTIEDALFTNHEEPKGRAA